MNNAGSAKQKYVHFPTPPRRSVFGPQFSKVGFFFLLAGIMVLGYDAVMWMNTGRWTDLTLAKISRIYFVSSAWVDLVMNVSLSWVALLIGMTGVAIGAALTRVE